MGTAKHSAIELQKRKLIVLVAFYAGPILGAASDCISSVYAVFCCCRFVGFKSELVGDFLHARWKGVCTFGFDVRGAVLAFVLSVAVSKSYLLRERSCALVGQFIGCVSWLKGSEGFFLSLLVG